MKFCTNCGASLEDKALFCTKCGTSLKENVKNEPEATPQNTDPMSAPTTILSHDPLKASVPTPASPADSPNSAAPVAARVSAPTLEKKQPSGIAVKLLSIFLCFILCVILTVTACLGIVRSTLDPDSIVDSFAAIEIEDIEKLTVTNDNGKEVPISSFILDFCDDEVKEKYDLDEDKIMEVLKDTKADEFLGEVVADYSAYFIDGDELHELDAERVVNWIRENEDAIEDVVEYEFKEADYEELEEELRRSDVIKSLSAKELEDELDMDLSSVHIGMSIWIYITLIILTCALTALIVAINRKKVRALFTYVTVCLTVVGCLYLIISGGLFIAMALLLPQIAKTLLSNFVWTVLICGAILFGVGLIASIVYKIIYDKRRARLS